MNRVNLFFQLLAVLLLKLFAFTAGWCCAALVFFGRDLADVVVGIVGIVAFEECERFLFRFYEFLRAEHERLNEEEP